MKSLGFLLLFVCGVVHAAGARVGFEYEHEKDNNSGVKNQALTVIPGWEFSKDSLINLVELSIERNRDIDADNSGVRARESKFFVRIRHNRSINDGFAYYIQGGIGRSITDQRKFSYAYIEPGLKYNVSEAWEWTAAVREIDSIDGASGQHARKFITGPSFSFDKNNEIELRYARGHGDKDVTSWSLGYTHKF
ncbi:MAG TPA: hypothetical protein VK642_09565 [Burkholderiales bacterium]|nr:hypothetical protein [Burkholderiales bacterium]